MPVPNPVPTTIRATSGSGMRGCGFRTDCPARYAAAAINASAAEWDPANATAALQLEARHAAARAGCATTSRGGILPSGGWCLVHSHRAAFSARHSGGTYRLPRNRTVELPAHHYAADGTVVNVLGALLLGKLPFMARTATPQSLADFGAGVGEYGHALAAVHPEVHWRGYDGAGNVEEFTRGFVRFVDLALPLALPRADWVLSLDVGEHVPPEHEAMYLRNLHAHNCRGVILKWAELGVRGNGHVNNHAAAYVRERMEELGYRVHPELSEALQTGAYRHLRFRGGGAGPFYRQLHHNLFAYERLTPVC